MLVALVLLALVGLFCVGVVGAVFSLAALLVVQRFGRGSLVVLWLVTSAALAALGTSRLPARRTGAGHDVNVPGLFALLLAWLLVIFAVPTFVAWRRPAVAGLHLVANARHRRRRRLDVRGTSARDLHRGHPEGRRCPVRHGALIHAHLPHRRVARPRDAQLRRRSRDAAAVRPARHGARHLRRARLRQPRRFPLREHARPRRAGARRIARSRRSTSGSTCDARCTTRCDAPSRSSGSSCRAR